MLCKENIVQIITGFDCFLDNKLYLINNIYTNLKIDLTDFELLSVYRINVFVCE